MAAPKRLYLIDGSGYIFRAFHALPDFVRKDGTHVGAAYGFCAMLLKLLDDLGKDADEELVAVVFDAKRATFRNEIYPEYKAHRPDPPPELIPQFGLIRDATRAFNIPLYTTDQKLPKPKRQKKKPLPEAKKTVKTPVQKSFGPVRLEGVGFRFENGSISLLLDIGMPGMDGYEFARRARERPEGRDAVLIALSGWSQEADRQRSRAAGIEHHLVKPADLRVLQAVLASVPEPPHSPPGH